MAAPQADNTPSLSEQYSLEKSEKPDVGSKPDEVKEVESPVKGGTEETGETPVSTEESTEAISAPVEENAEAKSAPVEASTESKSAPIEESTEAKSAPVEESTEANSSAAEDSSEAAPAAAEENSEPAEEENSADQEVAEETREIKLETAPADFRFPTTNQTRHCFTRYIEYHRCVAAKGEDATECDKFAKYYRSLCPTEWVERWNEQRENGTFPGPL